MKNAINPTRSQNFAEWYQEVIKAADLAEHSDVRGCMIIKPWGYAIWELIQSKLDKMIKETGHQNVYFPMLIPLSFLAKEADHVEGFAKECAIVTHYRLETNSDGKLIPSPDAELPEPLIIRPTSETVIGNAMSRWVASYNDLPILINQWCNVMRWEMRTRLFLRTSEFLWQEGHTAHVTKEEAIAETLQMLDVYEKLAADYLAIPVIKGEKTAGERFPGAVNTYAIESMMQDGKALQAGTSHFLGQNFSHAYDIKFTDNQQKTEHAWTTSWGVSTRLIGALIMTHSDDDGLVLPPKIAPQHIVLIPMVMKPEDADAIINYCEQLAADLKKVQYGDENIRVMIDKTNRRGGEKFWGSVKKGVPIRIEIGMREVESNNLAISRRDKPAKDKTAVQKDVLLLTIANILEEIQVAIFARAKKLQKDNLHTIHSVSDLEKLFNHNNDFSGFALAYMDLKNETNPEVENKLKELKLSIRCIPFDIKNEEGVCIFSGEKTHDKVLIARAY